MSVLLDYPYHTINHNLRLYILSFLSYLDYDHSPCNCEEDHGDAGCPKRDYGYFLSDPMRTIYRTSRMHTCQNIDYRNDFLLGDAYYSGTKSITLYIDMGCLPDFEPKLRRFTQCMHRQTIILSIQNPMTIEATDQLMKIVNQSWPKNVLFGISYDYSEHLDIGPDDHKALFQHLKSIVVNPLIQQVELIYFSIDTEELFICQHYYDLLDSIPQKCHKKFLCTESYIDDEGEDWQLPQMHILTQPKFWQLVVSTLHDCSVNIDTESCPKEILDAFLEHGFPRLDKLQDVPYGLLKEIVNRPHLHQYLSKELEVIDNGDLCELVDVLTKIKLDKLTLPWNWSVSNWSLLEQKIQQVYEKWGLETPIHIESGRSRSFYIKNADEEALYINQIKCDLVNLPTALSREITMALCNKNKQQ